MTTEWRYADQILRIDLTHRTAQVLPTDLELKRKYVGGAGFVARLLTGDEARPGDVALAGGPLSDGVAGRLALGARLGGRIACSSLGGRLAAALKEAGYDALVLTGELDRPGCLVIAQDDVRIEDAGALWGLEVPEAESRLAGEGFSSLVLGPAAENQVPFATLAHEGHHAGGSGVAAALGAKRIKAVLLPSPAHVPSRCEGCTLKCSGLGSKSQVDRAGALGLDAPTAARLAALAEGCARAGLLPSGEADPLAAIAYRQGIGALLAGGEADALSRLGPAAERIAAELPPPKRRGGLGLADLLGTCQRVFRDRPGELLRTALNSTQGLLTT
ncbi:MAG TPA: aldehyde ferredoxin oxidoreductase N-terminal domain-containing protein [Symbiobacteriaceae bacterium]|nr:aldehyde ferredoxin oxidoreductase N-terminal domain-containing protein [Symbiobacteriaceae bacterium]